jgi:hypothetical protein
MDDARGKSDGSERPPGAGKGRTTISGQQARQGHIVLRTRRRRAVFIGGLVAVVLLLVLFGAFA